VQSLTLHLGVQRNLTAFSPHKVVHHAVFCKYYAELEKFIVYHVVKVRIIFCRLSKLVNPFKDFYNQVTNPHYNATTDVYATMFFCDFINFVVFVAAFTYL
jgi:hypothetical protein